MENNNIYVYGSQEELDLHEYCMRIAWQDVFTRWYEDDVASCVKFVSSKTLRDKFSTSLNYMLPKTARNLFKKYQLARDAVTKYNSSATPEWIREKYGELYKIEQQICEKIYMALKPKWNDTTFVVIEACDDSWNPETGDTDESNMEDEFNSYDNLKFKRIFNNH